MMRFKDPRLTIKIFSMLMIFLTGPSVLAEGLKDSHKKILDITMDLTLEITEKLGRKVEEPANSSEFIYQEIKHRYDPKNDLFTQAELRELREYPPNIYSMVENRKWTSLGKLKGNIEDKVIRKTKYLVSLIKNSSYLGKNQSYTPRDENSATAKDLAELKKIWRQQLLNEYLGLITLLKDRQKVYELLKLRYHKYYRLYAERSDLEFLGELISLFHQSRGYSADYMPAEKEAGNRYLPFVVTNQICGMSYLENNCFSINKSNDNQYLDLAYSVLMDSLGKIKSKTITYHILGLHPAEMSEIGPVKFKPISQERINQYQLHKTKHGPILWYHLINELEFVQFNTLKTAIEENPNLAGIILDLRGSEFGRYQNAQTILGYFMEGPVMQVMDTRQSNEIIEVVKSSIRTTAPMVVLIDRQTSTASALMAATLKDTGRALLVGTEFKAYGLIKTFMPLNRFLKITDHNYGEFAIYMAEMFRVNGKRLHEEVIKPQIRLPAMRLFNSTICKGYVKTKDTPPTKIKFKHYKQKFDLQKLTANSQQRVKQSKWFQQAAKYYSEPCKKPNDSYALSLAVRKKQNQQALAIMKFKQQLFENDPYVKEAIHILADMQ